MSNLENRAKSFYENYAPEFADEQFAITVLAQEFAAVARNHSDLTWLTIADSQPSIGERILVWHPAYGCMFAYYHRDGFWEHCHGKETKLLNVTFWKELPRNPYDTFTGS